jgi:diguanylate cyclase (GGDEF)-like protein/PAS domain S-box-containing protein
MNTMRRADPFNLVVGMIGALIVGWLLADRAGVATQLRVFWLCLPAMDLVLFVVGSWSAGKPGIDAPERRFWRVYAFASLTMGIGDSTQGVVAFIRPGPGAASPNVFQAATVLVSVCALVYVMLTYPAVAASRVARIRYWLDAAAVSIGTGVFVWFTVMPHNGVGQLAQLLGAIILVVASFAGVKLVLSGATMIRPRAAAPILVGAAFQGFVVGQIGPSPRLLHVVLAGQVFAITLMIIGTRVHQQAPPSTAAPRVSRRASLLPYASLFPMFALFPFVRPGADTRFWVLVGGLLAVTALVVVRQVLAINENAALMRELGRQETRMRSLLSHSTDITSIVDPNGIIVYVTPAIERLLGYRPDEALGTTVLHHIHPEERAALLPRLRTLASTPDSTLTYTARYGHCDGTWRWLEVVSRNLLLDPGVAGILSNARDVTDAHDLEEQLRYQATHDALTGLANRTLFDQRLGAVAPSGRAAVLLVDLDDFKGINDTYGHHVGDAVLSTVAARLRHCVPGTGTAARLGGDEFAVLLPDGDDAAARRVAAEFAAALEQPIVVDGLPLRAQASVGVVAGAGGDGEALLRRADAAMYATKRHGAALNRDAAVY